MEFRGLVINNTTYPEMNGQWYYGFYLQDLSDGKQKHYIFNCPTRMEIDVETLGMKTDVVDVYGKPVYVGDTILFRNPIRNYQTHTGDNIPNGSYTEPMESEIKDYECEVVFENGIVGVTDFDGNFGFDDVTPLSLVDLEFDESHLKECIHHDMYNPRISMEANNQFWLEEVEYLCDEYGVENIKELLVYASTLKITGNIHTKN